jgi:hypothetical protein
MEVVRSYQGVPQSGPRRALSKFRKWQALAPSRTARQKESSYELFYFVGRIATCGPVQPCITIRRPGLDDGKVSNGATFGPTAP